MRLPKHLFDAITAARRAVDFTVGLDADTYAADVMVRSAVERQLEILGEACRRAIEEDADFRTRLPEAALAVALRNRIIHGYDKLEHSVLLDTVQRDLPSMIAALEAELAAATRDDGSG